MISKVKDTSAQSIQQYQKGEIKQNDVEKSVGAAATVVTEKVDLSTRAKDIQQIKQILNQTPEVREDKISELKHQIESGRYTVKSDQIAEKMVGESLIDVIA